MYGEGVDDSRKRRDKRDHLVLQIHPEESQEVGKEARSEDDLLFHLFSPTMNTKQQDDFRIVATRDFTAGMGTITDSSCAYSTNARRFTTIGYSLSTIVCDMERRWTMSLSVASSAVTETIAGLGSENSPSVRASMFG